jgi:hypothetical protein
MSIPRYRFFFSAIVPLPEISKLRRLSKYYTIFAARLVANNVEYDIIGGEE